MENERHRSPASVKTKCNGLDIDSKSLEFAIRNIQRNNLQSPITLLQTVADDPLLPLNFFHLERYLSYKTGVT